MFKVEGGRFYLPDGMWFEMPADGGYPAYVNAACGEKIAGKVYESEESYLESE